VVALEIHEPEHEVLEQIFNQEQMCSLTENEALCYLSWNDLWWFVAAVSNSGCQEESVRSILSGKNVLTSQLSSKFSCPLLARDMSIITSYVFSLLFHSIERILSQGPSPICSIKVLWSFLSAEI